MKQEWVLGFDPFVEWIGDKNNVNEKIWQSNAWRPRSHVYGLMRTLFLL
jgi:hypothetical protein